MPAILIRGRKDKILGALRDVYPAVLGIKQIAEVVNPGSKYMDYNRTTSALSKLKADDKVERIAPGIYQYVWTPNDGEFKRPRQWRVGRVREIEMAFEDAWPDPLHIQELPRDHDANKKDELARVSAVCSRLMQNGTIEKVGRGIYRAVMKEGPVEPITMEDYGYKESITTEDTAFRGIGEFLKEMQKLGINVTVSVDINM